MTPRDIADQARALSRIAKQVRDGAWLSNLDASWIEAAAKTLGDIAIERSANEKRR